MKNIRIKESKNADSRTAINKVFKDELLFNTKQHIMDVSRVIKYIIAQLRASANKHDHTKISHIDEFYEDFARKQAGCTKDFREMHWYKNIHLIKERHHLDRSVPEDVNLFDILERIADITTAGMGRAGKVYDDELSSEILKKAYKNTIELIKNKIIIEKK